MSNNEVSSSDFSQEKLDYWKKKNKKKKLLKLSFLIVILLVVGFEFSIYLSKLPRERHARKASYIEKVKLGLEKVWTTSFFTLNADHEDPKTKLPKVEIYIKGKRLDKLNESLPDSGKDEQKAEFKIKDKNYKVGARYRGDSINHWAFPNKSWRVILSKDKLYNGMKTINLNVPRVESQISNWLGYQMADAFGDILVPKTDIVHFRLNRQFDGIRLLLEQPDLEFINNRNLPPGKIYVGDIDSTHIYGGIERKRIYRDNTAWKVESATPDVSTREMNELLRIISEEHNPYEFYYKINQIFNVPALVKYIALLELTGSVHIDETHNGKYYFNPYSGRFSPIAWDTVAYFWKNNKGTDLSPNSLFRVVLSNPELRELKDHYLWEAINKGMSVEKLTALVDETAKKVRNDVRAFALKLHANDKGVIHLSNNDWENAIVGLKGTIEQRHERIKNHLIQNNVEYKIKPLSQKNKFLLGVKVNSASGATLKRIKINTSDLEVKDVLINRRGLEDTLKPIKEEVKEMQARSKKGSAVFKINDNLFSKRRIKAREEVKIVPGLYVYEVTFDKEIENIPNIALYFRNSITNSEFKAKNNNEIQIPSEHKVNSVWWKPSEFVGGERSVLEGDVTITEDIIVDKYSSLTIRAGANIKLGKDVSIIVDGGTLNIQGSKDSAVSITALGTKPWGVIAGLNSATINIENARITSGSDRQYNFVKFNSPISIHYSTAKIINSFFDSNISVKNSKLDIKNSIFESIFPMPLIIENSAVSTINNKYNVVKAVHKPLLMTDEPHGTIGRWEREHKYTFLNLNFEETDPIPLAEEIRTALKNKVNDSSFWSINKKLDDNYYVDDEVKDFVFRDVYFDTKDGLNHKHGVSYRYRNRYSSEKSYKYHNKDLSRSAYWPYRLEFQAKTKRRELGGGFSETLESRFEFRKESLPFSDENIPPAPPWDIDTFIPYFKTGRYGKYSTYPGKAIMDFYKETIGNDLEMEFEPVSVLMTDRYRQHLNLKTPWGTGPNPEQSYIITLDRSKIYNADVYLDFLRARKKGNDKYPEPSPDFQIYEIEVEFERNVSDKLDKEISEAEKNNNIKKVKELTEVRNAFIEDQSKLMKVISKYFADKGIRVEPIGKSKFVQAMDALKKQGI